MLRPPMKTPSRCSIGSWPSRRALKTVRASNSTGRSACWPSVAAQMRSKRSKHSSPSQPWYRPSESDASPRVRSTFTDVRRRVLPVMVQRRYAAAKQAYDNRPSPRPPTDSATCSRSSTIRTWRPRRRSPLSDIRTLATGFHQFAVAAATPPPPPPPPLRNLAAPVAAPAPGRHGLHRRDVDVAAPVAVRQTLPSVPQVAQAPLPPSGGVVEVVISEFGTIESP